MRRSLSAVLPGAENAALRPFFHPPFESQPSSCTTKHPCFAWVLCCGAEGGILRASFGQLAFHAAQPLGGASRGGKTPHCGLFSPALRIPTIFMYNKAPMLCMGALLWRRGWDSNPRDVSAKLISSQPRYDHFDTSARMSPCRTCGHASTENSIQETAINCNALHQRNPKEVLPPRAPERRPTF